MRSAGDSSQAYVPICHTPKAHYTFLAYLKENNVLLVAGWQETHSEHAPFRIVVIAKDVNIKVQGGEFVCLAFPDWGESIISDTLSISNFKRKCQAVG